MVDLGLRGPPTPVLLLILLSSCAPEAPRRPEITLRTWGHGVNAIRHGVASRTILIQNASVVNVIDGSVDHAQDLIIKDGVVENIRPFGETAAGDSEELVIGAGLFVIPGLWDMHVHLSAWGDAGRDLGFRMLLANGVTGVRDMGGFPGFLPRWREEINEGAVGPRLLYAGQAFSGPGAPWDSHVAVADRNGARNAVRQMRRNGADFIKVHRTVPPFVYPAIIEAAASAGLPVVGHVPRSLSVSQVTSSGQASIEHLFGIAGWFEDFFNPDAIRSGEDRVTPEMLETFELLKTRGTRVTPTTAVLLKVLHAQDDSYDRAPRRRFAPHSLHAGWDRERMGIRPGTSMENRRRYVEQDLAIVGAMHGAGVTLLTGSDTGAFDAAPGFELHDEFKMLLEAGLQPWEILRAATFSPAEFLGLLDQYGSVAEGKKADLVILSGDPTKDIKNLQRIEAVILRGELYPRDDLDRMLRTVERLAPDL